MTDLVNIDLLVNQLNEMDDEGRWAWVRTNADMVTVNLDNDDTFITFNDDPREDKAIVQFDWYIGWAEGLQSLAKAFNLNFECV